MARTAMKVDMVLLVNQFKNEDVPGKHTTQNKLWEVVTENYNAKVTGDYPKLSVAVVRSRILEVNLPINTAKGQRGRKSIHKDRPNGPRMKKGEKFKKNPEIIACFESQKKHTPQRFIPLVIRAENGSLKSAMKLKCLDCSGWSTAEVRDCAVKTCSLYPFRAYQNEKKMKEAA